MNDEKIITALLSNPTVKEAAENIGATPQTIYNRLRDVNFKTKYAEARQQVLEENCYRLQAYISDAVEQMHDMATDPYEKSQIKLNAADALLRHCYRLTELTDVLTRIERLEAEILKGDI